MLLTAILSLVLMISLFLLILAIVAFVQDKRWFTSAPLDIQRAIGEHPERFRGARFIGYILAVLAIVLFIGAFVYGAYDGIVQGWTFTSFLLRFVIMSFSLKLFDIIFLDWFLLTKSHFYQHYFPETEGCEGYHSFGFNRWSQLLSFPLYLILSAAIAFVCTLF